MIAVLQPYPAMKNPGVEWLGKVPAHWEIERLKCSLANIVEQAGELPQVSTVVALENVESWTGRVALTDSGLMFDSQLKRFRSGDILFGKLRPYLAKVARLTSSGLCVGEFLVLRPRHGNVMGPYFEYLLRSKPIIDAVTASTYGAKMPRADWGFIGGTPVVRPPLAEQAVIVRFLDHADRRIRRYIRAKEKLIALLEEQKQAVIYQAVTGQIDVRTGRPYPAYKPSGVRWLEQVPEQWDVAALRHRYSQCLGKMLDSRRITGDHSLPYLRNVDVQWDRINIENLPIMDIAPDEYERYTLQRGDLLVCEGGEMGRSALWSGDPDTRCGFQKALHRLRPLSAGRDVPRFMHYALRAAVRGNAFDDGHLSTIAHLTGEKLRTHRFPFPPAAEQELVVMFLDTGLKQVDRVISNVRRQVELLQKYRTCLVADVVTGKLDVRGVAAGLPEADTLAAEDNMEETFGAGTASEFDELDAAVEEVKA